MNVLKLINIGSDKLKSNNIFSHKLDSEILLSEILNKRREDLLVNLDEIVSIENQRRFQKIISRRFSKEPVAYILRKKEFWSKSFIVNKDVLIPRPETELMVEKIIEIFKKKDIYILDVGTGTGCILLSILSELKNSKGLGIDISRQAIEIANRNLHKLKLSNNIKFDVKSLSDIYWQKFDLIVSNPPYIKTKDIKNLVEDVKNFEPKLALDGGNDGLDVIKKVIYKSKRILKIKGMLALEIGNEQIKKVSKILTRNNFRIRYLIKDFSENIRCVLSTLEK